MWDDDANGIAIEFDSTYFHNCFYGARVSNIEAFPQSKNKFDEKYKNEGDGRPGKWSFWRWCEEDYLRNWQNKTWLKIQSGELAEEIFKKWKPLLDIFAEEVKNKKSSSA